MNKGWKGLESKSYSSWSCLFYLFEIRVKMLLICRTKCHLGNQTCICRTTFVKSFEDAFNAHVVTYSLIHVSLTYNCWIYFCSKASALCAKKIIVILYEQHSCDVQCEQYPASTRLYTISLSLKFTCLYSRKSLYNLHFHFPLN